MAAFYVASRPKAGQNDTPGQRCPFGKLDGPGKWNKTNPNPVASF